MLKAENLNPPEDLQTNLDYDKDIDIYFYKTVGYEAMWNFVNGLFPSPYAATSLREYFAIGFEEYFLNDKKTVAKLCPALFSKLEEIEYLEDK